MEGLSVVKADLSAFLHPSKTDDVQQGVLELLSSLLLRYNEEFDGVVLAYFDLKICDWTAKILNGLSPYLSLKLKAKLLLFSPKPGMLLEGKVNKVEKDYIGVIVLGIFNAAIACTDIREEFCYQENVDGIPIWASMSDNHMIRLGSKIKFSVKSVQEESFLDICGSLKPPDTGCVDWLLSPSDDKSKFMEVERKKHKKEKTREMRKEKINNEVKDSDTSNLDILYNHYHEREHNHRSKRRRNDRNAGLIFSILLFLRSIVSPGMDSGFYDIVDINLMVNCLIRCNLSRLISQKLHETSLQILKTTILREQWLFSMPPL